MVKYSDNPDYTHEQMELSTAYDLRNARVVQAQINSIDAAENCAAITLAGECAELAEKSVEAVKFFYHCENSTGTVEDLARGYKAFKENDFVIVLWVPASGEREEQFYIIGHVDIRGTERCNFSEYLLIGLDGNDSGNEFLPKFTWITIFDVGTGSALDVGTGSALDLAAFENIDELSPPKPSSFPCLYGAALSWIEYNFRNSIPAYVVGCAHHDTPGINPGTQTFIPWTYTRYGDSRCDTEQGMESTNGSFNLTTASYRGLNYNSSTNRYLGFEEISKGEVHVPGGCLWWRLIDTTNANAEVPLYLEYTVSATQTGTWDAVTGTTHTVESSTVIRFSSAFSPTVTILSGSSSMSGHSSSSPAVGDYWSAGPFSPISPTYCTGELGFYILALCDDELRRANRLRVKFAGGDWNPVSCDWPNITMDQPYHTDTGDVFDEIADMIGASAATVSFFQDIDVSVVPVPLPICLTANQPTLANGLDLAVRPLRRKIFEEYHPAWSSKRPSIFSAMRRKTND